MSLYKNDNPLDTLFENLLEDSEESEDEIDGDTGSEDYEFLDPCNNLEECNISFLHKIFADNEEISSSDYENDIEFNLESSDESDNESQNEQFAYDGSGEFDEIIRNIEQKDLTACVIIDAIDGKFQRCEKEKGNIRQLRNLIRTWQVDRDAIKEVEDNLQKLGICDSHFQFDNKYLHNSKEKQLKHFEMGIIQWCRCISCNKYVTFFSRGIGCTQHSWYLNEHNIQVPCIGQYGCEALKVYRPLCIQAFNNININQKSLCCSCYEKLGGHIYQHPGRGKKGTTCKQLHLEDISKGLEFLGNWLIEFSQSQDKEIKNKALIALTNTLSPFTSFPFSNKQSYTELSSTDTNQIPSLFITKMLFIKSSIKVNNQTLKINNYKELGRVIGKKLWDSRSDITQKKFSLELPQTIQKYYDAFLNFLTSLFSGIINKLREKKMEISNRQRRKRKKPLATVTYEQTIKIVTFIASMIVGLAFPSLKIWLPQVLASLCCKPRLLSSLYQLLTICYVTSHTDRHERKLANARMEKANPTKRLIQEKNIWNLAIIDNIDFKEKSFKFGNIYDVTRESSHAILRMAFQAQLPIERTEPEVTVKLTADTPLFGMNFEIGQILITFQETLKELLHIENINGELSYKRDFDAETIKHIILSKLDYRCLGPSPNVIILESGINPNSDEEILRAAEMYKKDFDLEDSNFFNIVADETIYHRLVKGKKKWPKLRPHLGQWHTSKDFCSVLLVLFSNYGLLSLASRLGVKFLDKFEIAVDYRSTARILDLL